MNRQFYAHSGTCADKSDWQLLSDHLQKVSERAADNARYFNGEAMASLAGNLHDLGKYSDAFQRRLEGGPRVDHATAGAKVAVEKWGALGKMLAYVIAGHHAGLANGVDEGHGRAPLQERLARDVETLDAIWQDEIDLPEKLLLPSFKPANGFEGFQFAFFTRMLFSCVVDADFIDTERFYQKLNGKRAQRGSSIVLQKLKNALDEYLEGLCIKALQQSASKVNILRQEILQHVRRQAKLEPGLFQLTVPTGGGKTLSSMAFALDHAIQHDLRRVIYVIPFTSIIEQNADVFRKVFVELGDEVVLEHHSAFDDEKFQGKEETKDKLKLAMENWDASVVVTTAVQFFESLFADRTSKCRKLHNITGSVIILDEAQMLPLKLLRPTMAAIDELARNYRCSIILCTATQPALLSPDFTNGFENVREIAPDPGRLYSELERTVVSHIGEQDDDQLRQRINDNHQILVIVNNRRHARELFCGSDTEDGLFHLTTLMCAKHRREILAKAKERLAAGESCKLISTSLIEAGVDVSFPLVMRAETGLDSVAQAAGRCNREGIWKTEDSKVLVFNAPEWKAPPEISQYAASLRHVLRNHQGSLLAPEAIKAYFEDVYWQRDDGGLDEKGILKAHRDHRAKLSFPFQNIARDYRIIESQMRPVIIPYDKQAEQLVESLRHAEFVGKIARGLQPYLVQVPQGVLEALQAARMLEPIQPERFGAQFNLLINKDLYDEKSGLDWSNPQYIKIESGII
jgi:CRISPR-associated endonuclease/helicase Cas3